MATLTDVLDPQRIISSTTRRIIQSIDGVIEQSFNIKAYGLLINAELNLYVNGQKANTSQIKLLDRPTETFSSDSKGEVDFVYFYTENLSRLTGIEESKFQEYIDRNTGKVELVLVDKASVNSNTLSKSDINTARCISFANIERSYNPLKTQTTDVIIIERETNVSRNAQSNNSSNNAISGNSATGTTFTINSNNQFETSLAIERLRSRYGNLRTRANVSFSNTSLRQRREDD